jgi:hypothetical protein
LYCSYRLQKHRKITERITLSNHLQTVRKHTAPFVTSILLLLAVSLLQTAADAQTRSSDTLPALRRIVWDSLPAKHISPIIARQKNAISSQFSDSALRSRWKNKQQQLADQPRKLVKQTATHLANSFAGTPRFRFGNGFVSYQLHYRAYIDTPFVTGNILQHSLSGSTKFTLFNQLPFQVNFLFRRTNSSLFTNINDVQIVFNAAEYRNQLQLAYRQQLQNLRPPAADSLLELSYKNKRSELAALKNKLHNPFNAQQLVACNEILTIPGLTRELQPAKADSLKAAARQFINWYEKQKGVIDSLQQKVDTLQQLYNSAREGWARYKEGLQNNLSPQRFVKKAGRYRDSLSSRYNKFFALRNFGLGRNFISYSELTVKNISLNGINAEYNSRYYLAFAAGLVDFRFRDFVATRLNHTPQHLLALRAGIGSPEQNFLIGTVYKGEKQMFLSTGNISRPGTVTVYGISLEAKYIFTERNYLVAEAAQSSVPAILRTGGNRKSFLPLSDKTNKALSVKFSSFIRRSSTSIEGLYKYTGANFHSLSSYQTNASLRSWYLKIDQPFFKRALRVTASLRSNEFTNPFIVQRYKANTVFKTFNLAFRKRKWPTLTAGYIPVAQLTALGDQLVENHFHTLNASASHNYKLGASRASTSLVYSRFFNDAADSSLLYYNAQHLFINHTVFFGKFSAQVAVSHSRNTGFEMSTLEETVQVNIRRLGALGFGVKISNLNRAVTKTGAYGSMRFNIKSIGVFHLNYDNNFLPGAGNVLVRNEMMNMGLTRNF